MANYYQKYITDTPCVDCQAAVGERCWKPDDTPATKPCRIRVQQAKAKRDGKEVPQANGALSMRESGKAKKLVDEAISALQRAMTIEPISEGTHDIIGATMDVLGAVKQDLIHLSVGELPERSRVLAIKAPFADSGFVLDDSSKPVKHGIRCLAQAIHTRQPVDFGGVEIPQWMQDILINEFNKPEPVDPLYDQIAGMPPAPAGYKYVVTPVDPEVHREAIDRRSMSEDESKHPYKSTCRIHEDWYVEGGPDNNDYAEGLHLEHATTVIDLEPIEPIAPKTIACAGAGLVVSPTATVSMSLTGTPAVPPIGIATWVHYINSEFNCVPACLMGFPSLGEGELPVEEAHLFIVDHGELRFTKKPIIREEATDVPQRWGDNVPQVTRTMDTWHTHCVPEEVR